jgi:hypothetical protein
MSKNSMPAMIAALLIVAFVHNTAFAQAANYQAYQSTGRLAMTPANCSCSTQEHPEPPRGEPQARDPDQFILSLRTRGDRS